eukprot:GILI01012027.1.p1 GENE.GILI01012027.1~~GILI01012027.1.p1  ORF type:complete len:797 (-),score=182.13 GILI01012027.1:295-2685(-)
MLRAGCSSSITSVRLSQQLRSTSTASSASLIKLFSVATSSAAGSGPLSFSAQLPIEADGIHLLSSNGLRVQLPMEVVLDNDATTFDANAQRHSIVSPTLIDGLKCQIKSIREVAVADGNATPFVDRLASALKATDGDEVSSGTSTRHLLIEWDKQSSTVSLQPNHSPYSILADPQGTEIEGKWYSSVPVSAFEPIARVIADGASTAEQEVVASGTKKKDTKKVNLDHYFDQHSEEPQKASLSPLFYRNMRVPIQYTNVFEQQAAEASSSTTAQVSPKSDSQSVSKVAASADSILPHRVPIDLIHWDHNLMYQHGPSAKTLCNSFEEGCTAQVTSNDINVSHATLRANMKRQPPPAFAVIRTDSKDATKFPAAANKLVRMIENFGFGVLEDMDALGGFPSPKGGSEPLLYTKPTPGVDDDDNSNALIVDYRASKAEQLITKVFGQVRNCHYGLFSTWSNGDRWKFEDLSDDEVLMGQLDAHNARNGHATRHLSTDGSSAKARGARSLQVLNKSGSNPHADGAYSGIHLDLHTDNTYFLEVPRLQAYGCIFTHTTKTTGGESSLVDGARVALEVARLCSPKAISTITGRRLAEKYSIDQRKSFLDLLCTVPVSGRYEKEGHFYNGFKPIITLTKGATPQLLAELAAAIPSSTTADGSPNADYIAWCRRLQHAMGTARPLIDSISFNNSDRLPLNPFITSAFAAKSTKKADKSLVTDLTKPDRIREFYMAYEWFHSLVHDPELAIHFTLKPGQMLFFDNQRTLHGRLEFNGPRVMCGSYVASDEYYSTLKAMCASVNAK